MPSRTEYVLNAQGQALRRSITEQQIEITAQSLAVLGGSIKRVCRNAFTIPGWDGLVNLIIDHQGFIWPTMQAKGFAIRAPFRLVDKVLVPNFSSDTDTVFTMPWAAPFTIRFFWQAAFDGDKYSLKRVWLFAYDERNATYRMPLPNLHDDCQVCTGASEKENYNKTLAGLLADSLERFNTSKWNADLWEDPEKSQNFFRFKPKNDSFEQLPIEGKWTDLCLKVAVDSHSQNAILL